MQTVILHSISLGVGFSVHEWRASEIFGGGCNWGFGGPSIANQNRNLPHALRKDNRPGEGPDKLGSSKGQHKSCMPQGQSQRTVSWRSFTGQQ
jgi:hypothetical protein